MSVWTIVNELHAQEASAACLAVQTIQTGGDPTWYLERAGRLRAEAYEFRATGVELREIVHAHQDRFHGASA